MIIYVNNYLFFTVFALWLNSLDVTPAVNNLYEDVKVLYKLS